MNTHDIEHVNASGTADGKVTAAHGSVINVDFPGGTLSNIHHALLVEREGLAQLAVEVQAHLDATTVRCLSLAPPTAVHRGLAVHHTGQPLLFLLGMPSSGVCSTSSARHSMATRLPTAMSDALFMARRCLSPHRSP
jgi:hypothetical protein